MQKKHRLLTAAELGTALTADSTIEPHHNIPSLTIPS